MESEGHAKVISVYWQRTRFGKDNSFIPARNLKWFGRQIKKDHGATLNIMEGLSLCRERKMLQRSSYIGEIRDTAMTTPSFT